MSDNPEEIPASSMIQVPAANQRRPNIPVLNPRFFRFMLVGFINTVVGYGLFAVLSWVGMSYPWAIGLATLGGVAFNFQSTGRLVFGGAPSSRIARFVVVYCLTYGMNVAAVALLLRWGLNVYVANALTLLPLALIAFFLQQKFVFKAS